MTIEVSIKISYNEKAIEARRAFLI